MNSLLAANISCLEQGVEFLSTLPPDLYQKKCPSVFGSTIGGHFRHNLDHYAAFLDGYSRGKVDYDARKRDTRTEKDPQHASDLMEQHRENLGRLAENDLDKILEIRMDDGDNSSWSQTTVRRELQFLLSHTIHHYALVVSISCLSDYSRFPDNFGVAPSTLHHQQGQGIE